MSIFNKLSYISRRRKIESFYSVMKPDSSTKILDIGAEISPLGDRGLQLIDSYEWKGNITAANLFPPHIENIKKYYPEVQTVVANACKLPWPDKFFDVVYSNAVIEHVGGQEQQKQMADEIMRVGKAWFVTTPNRRYPFEFHMRLPLVTLLPGDGYLRAGKFLSYNHVKKKYAYGQEHNDLHLLTAKQLQHFFPTSSIVKMRVTFMAETLVAIGGEDREFLAGK